MLEQPLVFNGCASIRFFNSLPFPNTVIEAAQDSLPHTLEQL